jgi:Tat protein secretion system quality control protein TatD with DNase activity
MKSNSYFMTFRQGGVDSPWELLQKANSNHPQPPNMVVSKAACSQRVRRAAESVKKTIAHVGIHKRKAKPLDPKPMNDPPILIRGDAQPQDSSKMGDIFEIYDHEVSLVDEAQQIMEWCDIEEQSDTDGKESEEVVKQHKRQ